MKKFIGLLSFIFLTSFFPPTNVIAQIEAGSSMAIEPAPNVGKIMPAPDYQGNTFLGQNHSYSVVFRGNGEAVVSARVALGNSTDASIKEVKLRIPRVQASGIYAFQIFKDKQCIRYEQSVYDPITRSYPTPLCAEYQEPDYYNDYSYYNAKYKKADFEYANDTLTVKLPKAIEANKSGAFFIYFRAMGYTKKNAFGAYDYTFETLQVEDNIRNINIGLSTDSDLFMKGVKGEVDYRFNDAAPTMAKLAVGSGEGVTSSALDNYVSQIGYGRINKNASNLSPLESYKVTGSYADARGKLYGKEITVGISVVLGLLALFVLLIMVVVRLLKRGNPPSKKEVKDDENIVKEKPRSYPTSNGKMFAVIVILGFIVSLVVAVYTVLTIALGSFLTGSVYYTYQGLIGVVLVIISILVYILLIFTPGILIGVKKGAGWGIGTVVSTVLWLIFWTLLIFLGLFLFSDGTGNIYPIPMMKAL